MLGAFSTPAAKSQPTVKLKSKPAGKPQPAAKSKPAATSRSNSVAVYNGHTRTHTRRQSAFDIGRERV